MEWLIAFVLVALVLLGLFIIFRLLPQLKNLRRELQQSIAENNRLRQQAGEFVANVSHELKTPLTSIVGYTETLKAVIIKDPDRALEFLGRIEENTNRLSRLINDILDLSRIEQPNFYLERQNVSLEKLINEIKSRFHFGLSQRNQYLTTQIEAPEIYADPWLVEQALANLVENAHRYCPEGTVIEIASRLESFQGKNYIAIHVSDNGPGINPEDLPRIFERFYRAEKSRNRLFGGTGLGLAIVHHIMMSHGGTALVESKHGFGSKFSLLFPKPEKT